jgi:hypothetical protein
MPEACLRRFFCTRLLCPRPLESLPPDLFLFSKVSRNKFAEQGAPDVFILLFDLEQRFHGASIAEDGNILKRDAEVLKVPLHAGDVDVLQDADSADGEEEPRVRLLPRRSDEQKDPDSGQSEERDTGPGVGHDQGVTLS